MQPRVIFKKTGARRTGMIATAEPERIRGGQVAFQFRSKAELETFRARLRQLYPMLSSTPFARVMQAIFGAGVSAAPVGGRRGLQLTRAQLQQMTDATWLARRIDETRAAGKHSESFQTFVTDASGKQVPAPILRQAADNFRYLITQTDSSGRTVFNVFDAVSNQPTAKPTRNGRINSLDVEAVFLNSNGADGFFR